MNKSTESTNLLLDNLEIIKAYDLSNDLIIEIEDILKSQRINIDELYKIITKKIEYIEKQEQEIQIMRESIEAIEDYVRLMKIDADAEFLENKNLLKIQGGKFSDNDILEKLYQDNIYKVELISSLLISSNGLRKDLVSISKANNNEHVLSIQQDFNHSLRKLVRAVVQNPDVNKREMLGQYITTLISYGQDGPDIFDERKNLIEMTLRLEQIANENIAYTQQLNEAVYMLVNDVKNKTEFASHSLNNTIRNSRALLYVIAFIALAVSFLIAWRFIYKIIVVKLAYLSSVTKRLSRDEFDFEIDTRGEGELMNIAVALDSLRDHSLKRASFNQILQDKSLKLKRSNDDLSQFAYIASHDLQEPLRMVGSYVQLLKKKYRGKLDSDADQFIDYAVDGCVRMKSLIDGVLTFSRVESNAEEMEQVSCERVLQEVMIDLSVKLQERNARVTWGDMPLILAIPSQVRTVFENLISNGIKYCDHEVPQVEIEATLLTDKVRFSVKDNGIGVDKKYQDKIFIIFKRLHSRDQYGGTGIGLSICKKIIERHGGEISLESSPGEGTTFYFTLPFEQEARSMNEYKVAV